MRNIKFRGQMPNSNQWIFFDVIEYFKNDDMPKFLEYQMKNIGQYTGFKDFDGKEIYEGDILEYVHYARLENKRIEIVEFDEKCGGWYVHKKADALCNVLFEQHNEEWQKSKNYKPSQKHKVRIIGNIYENKELITK